MMSPQLEYCKCGHTLTQHRARFNRNLLPGKCLIGECTCAGFRYAEAADNERRVAQQQAAHKERCERLAAFINTIGIRCGHDPESDVATVEYMGHKFQIREIDEG